MQFPIEHPIKNYKHLSKLSKSFDKRFKTKTYWAELSPYDIVSKLHNETDPSLSISKFIQEKIINRSFVYKNEFYSNDYEILESPIGKLNSLYLLMQCETFRLPMSISLYKNGEVVIHPGGTRILLAGYYTKPVPCYITYYDNIPITNRYKNIEFISLDDYYIDLPHPDGQFNYWESFTRFEDPKEYTRRAKGEDLPFKQIIDLTPETGDNKNTYHDPRDNNPPRHYIMKDDKIYVDGLCIIEKHKETWVLTK